MKIRWFMAIALVAGTGLAQQPDMEAAMKALAGLQAAQSKGAGAVVDFRELKAVLPESLPSMKRTSAKGQKNAAMGMSAAEAEGHYESENGESSIVIKITDIGGTGLGGMAAAAWMSADVDSESDDGYERTVMVDSHKALEKFDTKNKSGNIKTIVGGRFMVEVEGNQIKADQLKATLKKVSLSKLEALKPKT